MWNMTAYGSLNQMCIRDRRIDVIRTRLFGSKIYVDIEIAADDDMTLKEAHTIAEKVHRSIETVSYTHLHGDFGVSAKTGRDIKTTIFESFKVSAKLGGMAIITALIFGLIFGSIAALTRNKLPDRLIIFFSTLFTSLPSFVFASLLLLVFCVTLKWIPVWDPNNPNYLLPVIALSA